MRPPTDNRRPARARRSAIAALCLLVAGLGAAHALAAGGLSVTPGILEHVAQPGAVGPLTVSNTTSRPMRVSIAARPWLQSRSGSVVANRRRVLGKVRAGRRSFRLAAGGDADGRPEPGAPAQGRLVVRGDRSHRQPPRPAPRQRRQGRLSPRHLAAPLPAGRRASLPARARSASSSTAPPATAPSSSRSRTAATRSTRSAAWCASAATTTR